MRKLLYSFAFLLVLIIGSITQALALPGWSYRQILTINNNAGPLLTNYQVLFTVNTQALVSGGKMQANGNDIRFTANPACSTLYCYSIEKPTMNTATTKLWIKIPSIPANSTMTIQFWYGNPTAPAGEDGVCTFDFFDDFLGNSLDLTKWRVNNNTGNHNVVNDRITINSSGEYTIRTIPGINTPTIAESYVVSSNGNWPSMGQMYGLGTTDGFIMFQSGTAMFGSNVAFTSCTPNGWVCWVNGMGGPAIAPNGIWYLDWTTGTSQRIAWNNFGGNANINGFQSNRVPPAQVNIGLGGLCSGTSTMVVDWTRARKWTQTPPTVTAGNEQANIITVTPLNPQRCSSDPPTQLTGNYPPDPNATYTWNPGNLVGPVVNVSPVVTTIYTVTALSQNGCGGSATVTVTVLPAPVLSPTRNPLGTVCPGQSVTLDAGGNAPTYTWTGPNNQNVGNTRTVTVNPLVTTTYTVQGPGANGCIGTGTITVTVFNTPINVQITPANPTRCTSDPPTTLTASGASTYAWSNGGTGATISVSPNVTTTYTVTGTDVNGCTGTASVNLVVTPTPNQPGVLTGPTQVCLSNNSVRYSIPFAPNVDFSWTSSCGAVTIALASPSGNQIDVTYPFNIPGPYPVTCDLVATPRTGACVGPARTYPITVITLPAQPAPITGPVSLCPGDQGSYSVAAVPTAVNYLWTVAPAGPTILSGQGTTDITVRYPNAGTYTLTVTPTNSCGNGTPRTLTVVVNPNPPAPTISAITNPVCPNQQNTTYTVNDIAGTTYTWTVPNGVTLVSGQGTNSINVNWGNQTPGLYNIRVVPTRLGCVGAQLTIPILVQDPPPPAPSAIVGPSPICQNSTQTYQVNLLPTATFYTWDISPSGPTITGQGTNVISIDWGTNPRGNYTLSVIAGNSCGVGPATTRVLVLESIPVQPGSISGPPYHCLNTQRTYTVTPIANATSYTWTNSCGWSGASNTNSITYTATTMGPCVISVTANNFCGSSPASTLTVSPIDVPAQPSQISGVALVCQNQVENYMVTSVANVTYTWSGLPNGATITSGQGTNTISVDWGLANPGTYTLRVVPNNVCGNGLDQTLSVTVRTVPAQPQGLNGPTDVCEDVVSTYSLTNVIGVTYTWSLSPNGPILIPSGSSAIVNWNNRPGVYVLTVTPSNSCGNGVSSSITIRVTDKPNVNGGMDQVVCGPNTVLVGSPVGGVWSCEVCPAPAQIVSAGPFGIVTRMSPALHVFKYSITDPICGVVEDFVTVRNDLPITGTVVGDATVCGGSNGTLQLIGYTPGARIVRWESSTDNFISAAQIGNFSDTYTYSNITQTTQFRAVLEMNGLCAAVHSGHNTITVRPNSPASVVNGLVTVCASEAIVNAVAPVSGNGSWSFVSGPGGAQIVTSGTQGIISGLTLAGDYVFRWTVINPPCTPSTRDVVVRRLEGVPNANAGANQRVCSDNATLVGNLPPNITGQWSFVSGPPAVVITAGQTGLVSGMTVPGDYVFRWTLTNAICNQSTFSDVVVSRFAPVTPASAGQNQQICGTTATVLGNRPLSGVGMWSFVSGPSGAVPSITTNGEIGTILNMSMNGDYVFRWTISNGVCPPSSSDVTITKVDQAGSASVPVSTYNICDRTDVNLVANPAQGGSGRWEFLQGPSSPVNVVTNGANGLATGLTGIGTYRFRWVVSNGCGTSEVVVVVNRGQSFSPPPFAGSNQNVCETSNALVIGSQAPQGYTGVWRFVSGPMVASVNTFGNFGSVVNMMLPGPYIFVWEVGNGGICPTQVAQVTITRVANVTPADAGSNQMICGTSTTLQGNVPLTGVGSWSFVDGPRVANISFTNNVASVSGMDDAGVYTFRYTISNPPCANSTSDVRITVSPGTVGGNLGGGGTVCSGQNSGTLSLSGQRGDIVRWEMSNDNFVSFNIINNQSVTQSYSNLTQSTWYRVVVKNGSCPEMMSNAVKITVNPAAVQANAGGNRTVCGTSINLEGNDPMGGTGTWAQVSGPGGISLVQAGRLAILTNLSPGTYVFSYTIMVSGCGSTVSNMILTVRAASVGGTVSSNQTVCGTNNGGQLVLTGNVGTVVRWESSTDNFGSVVVYQNTSNILTFTNVTETTQFRAVVKNGSCAESFATAATIFVRSGGSVANAGMDKEVCGTSVTLTGMGGMGDWSLESAPNGNGALLLPNSPDLTVLNLDVAGEYVFRYTINDPICGNSFDEVLVRKLDASIGGAVSQDITVCKGNNSGLLQLGGYTGEIIRWEESVNNWLTWVNINNTTPTLEFFNLTQTTQFRGIVKNGSCGEEKSFHATVYVIDELPAANAGLDQVICGMGTSLQGNHVAGVWSYLSGPQSPILTQASGNAQVNGLVAGTYRFMFEITNGSCGSTSDVVEVMVQPTLTGGSVSTDMTVCGGVNSGMLTLTGTNGVVMNWETSVDAFVTTTVINNTNTIQTFSNLMQTVWYRAKVSLPGCGVAYSAPAKITVLGATEVAQAGFNQEVCGTSAVLTGNSPVNGVGTWSIVSVPNGVNPTLTQSGSLAQVDGMTVSGLYRFKYSISNGNCPVNSAEVTVSVSAPSVAGQLTTNAPFVCSGVNSGMIMLSGNVGGVIRWELSRDNFVNMTTVSSTQTTFMFNNLTQTTKFRPVVKSGSCAPVNGQPIEIVVNVPPVGGMVMGSSTVCVGTNAGTLTLMNHSGNVVRWERSTDGFVNIVQISTTTNTYNYTNLTATTQFRAVVESPGCGTQLSAPATVVVSGQSVGGFVTGGTTVCSGSNSGLLVLTGQVGNVVHWEMSTDAGFAPSTTLVNTTVNQNYGNLTMTTYYRALVGSANCTPVYSSIGSVTVSAPSVGGQLNGTTQVCTGNNSGVLTLSGNVGTIVRWERSTDGQGWISMPNTTNNWTFVNLTESTFYRVVVKNGACPEAMSVPIRVDVNALSVGGSTSGNTTICSGVPGVMSLSGQLGQVVRWESSTDCSGFNNLVQNVTTSTTFAYNLTQTTCFRAVVKNGVCNEVVSSVSRVEVMPGSNAGVVNGGATVCGSNANGSLSVSGFNGSILRWEFSTLNNPSWLPINNTNSVLNYSNLTQTTRYRVVVQRNGCPEAMSAPAEVSVSSPSLGGTLTGGGSGLCFGQNSGSLNLSGFNGTIVRWEGSLDGLNWTNLNNQGVNLSYNNLTATTRYRVVVKNGSCPEAFSNVVTIGVAPELVLNAGAVTGCTNVGSITAVANGGNGGYVYSIDPAVASPNTNGQFSGIDPGVYTIRVRDVNGCESVSMVTVSATPTPTSIVSVNNVTSSSGVITWATVQPINGVTYNLRYRVLGEPTFTVLTGLTGNSRFISGLQNNTTYEIYVQYVCPGGFVSGFSNGILTQFTTLRMGTGDCATSGLSNVPVPGGVFLDQVTVTSARVNWNLVANAAGYIVSYGPSNVNPNNWFQAVVCDPSRSFIITNLQPNANYGVRVRTNCSNCTTAIDNNDKRSVWSNVFSFQTPGSKLGDLSSASSNTEVSVYPNPTKGLFTVQLTGESQGAVAEVFDLTGRMILRSVLTSESTELNLDSVSSGVYTLKVTVGNEVKVVKVVKE